MVRQLQQRRVFRVAGVYAVAAFAIVQVADPVLGMAGAPAWVSRVVLVLLGAGFVLAVVLSWAFDITPDGVKRAGTTETHAAPARRPRGHMLSIAGAILVISATAGWFALRPRAGAALDPEAIAILPFDVAADPALAYLREGMVDLLAATLSSGAGVRAVDPRAAIAAWRRASGEDAALTERDAAAVARQLGAGRLLLGSAVGTPQRIIVNVRLYDVARGGDPLRLHTEGPADSISDLIDDLASQLLARDARVPEHHLAALTTTSLPALRLYLDAVRNYRLGRCADATRQLTDALEQDTTFALAAIQLLLCAGEGDLTVEPALGSRSARLAWAASDRLSQRDRLFLEALLGPRYPARSTWSELIQARERAVAAIPDRPELRLLLGHSHRLSVATGNAGAVDRAAEFYRGALALDSTYASALRALARHNMDIGDSATVRHLARRLLAIEPTGENADFMRWLAAAAGGDARELAEVRARMPDMHPTALGWIVLGAINYGVDMDGGEAAAAALRATARTTRERLNFAYREIELLYNRGRIAAMEALNDSVGAEVDPQGFATRRLWGSLYWGADTAGVGHAVTEVTRRLDAAATPADSTNALPAACAAGMVRTAGGDAVAARRALEFMHRRLASLDPISVPYRHASMCGAALEAWIALAERRPETRAVALRADSVFRADPRFNRAAGNFAQLVLARVFDELGDAHAALSIIRLRVTNDPAFFLATILREEGRLAARTGDRDGAIRAYRHYLTMRTDPDPSLRGEVDQVRAELQSLIGTDTRATQNH